MKNQRSKIKNIFNILYVFLIFTFLYLIFANNTNAQYLRYPISELGNCRNQQECYLYCQIPENTPDCWSYGKYVMNPQESVLGETTVNITYPIPELGNCTDANACFIYCNQPKHQTACYSYAKSHGLIKEEGPDNSGMSPEKMQEILDAAKTELGCASKTECMSICNEPANHDKCMAFAKKHNLGRHQPSVEIMEKAKTELGCSSERSCMEFCNNPENIDKCMDFAKRHKMMSDVDYERHQKEFEKYKEQKEKMLEEAKRDLGCDSYESCARFCGDPNNVEKCMNLGRRHRMVQPKPCTSEAECRAYCEKNPTECPGFPKQYLNAR